jgi:hypothetical protein
MTAIAVTRGDAARNMHRYYRLGGVTGMLQ